MPPAGPRGGASTPTSQSRRDATGRHGDSGVGRESRHGDSCAVDASHAVLTCGRETDATAATAAAASRGIRTKKLKLVTSQPTVKRFFASHNYFRFRDTDGQSRSISTFSTYAAPPSGTISKCGQVRRPYIEPLYQPTKFEKNRTRGSIF